MNTQKIFGYGTQNLLCAFAVILALTALSLTGCDNGSNDDNSGNSGNNERQTTTNVYVLGAYENDDNYIPCYWKNGVRTDLDLPTPNANSYAQADYFAVSGSDVYVAGYCREITGYNEETNIPISTYTPCYWKNGVRTDLTLNTDYAWVDGIAVSGSDVYIAGSYGEITYNEETNIPISPYYTACYWKNGVKTDLSTNAHAIAGGIAVSGSDVYVAGRYTESTNSMTTITTTACYWKNGVRTDLFSESSPGYAQADYIAVSGSDVYVAGSYQEITGYNEETNNPIYTYTACYWKNGVRTDLFSESSPGYAQADYIAVSGSDVYITGRYQDNEGTNSPFSSYTSCYWKNGVRIDLPTNAQASEIAVSGSDVYVAGHYYSEITYDEYANPIYTVTACYWKNGTLIELGEGAAIAITVETRE